MEKIVRLKEGQLRRVIENVVEKNIKSSNINFEDKKNKIEKWFLNLLKKSKKITHPDYPGYIFYIHIDEDGDPYIGYNKKNHELSIDYDTIWSYFEKNYSSKYTEIESLISDLIEEHLDPEFGHAIPTPVTNWHSNRVFGR